MQLSRIAILPLAVGTLGVVILFALASWPSLFDKTTESARNAQAPISLPQLPERSVAPEIGGVPNEPRPGDQAYFAPVFDPSFMIETECFGGNHGGKAAIVAPNTTVPIKIRFRSVVDYTISANFTAWIKERGIGVTGVSYWFDQPYVIIQPGSIGEVTLFVKASKDVKDTTTVISWFASTRALHNPKLSSGSSGGDWLYLMVGEKPNVPQLFVFYPSVKVNGAYVYKAGEKPERIFLSLKRGQSLNITVPIFVKSNASYPINFTARDPYLLPNEGVTATVSPRWVMAKGGDTIEFIMTVNVGKDFVGLRKDYWPPNEPMHGRDLYMLIRLTDTPGNIVNGWCKLVNLPYGNMADAVFFEVKDG